METEKPKRHEKRRSISRARQKRAKTTQTIQPRFEPPCSIWRQ